MLEVEPNMTDTDTSTPQYDPTTVNTAMNTVMTGASGGPTDDSGAVNDLMAGTGANGIVPPNETVNVNATMPPGPQGQGQQGQGGPQPQQAPQGDQSRSSPAQDAIAAAEGKKRNAGGLFHHLFDSLAGYNIKMDENGEMVPVQRKGTGAIMRGIVAGAITGMASAEDSKGGFAQGFAAGAKARQSEIQGENNQMQAQNSAAFQRRREIYEMNLHTALNQAQIENLNSEAQERSVKMYDDVAATNRAINANMEDADETQGGVVNREGITPEELTEGMQSGKYHAGDHLGMLVRVEPTEDNKGFQRYYSVVRDGPVDVNPELYDKLARMNPDAFPPNVSDSAKTFTASASTLTHQVQSGLSNRIIPDNYLGHLKDTVKKIDPELASKMPDYTDNTGLYKDLKKASTFIAGAGGSIPKGLEMMSKQMFKDKFGNEIPTAQSRLATKIVKELGNGDPVLGGQIMQKAIDAEDALRAEAKTKLTREGKEMNPQRANDVIAGFESDKTNHGGFTPEEYAKAQKVAKLTQDQAVGKAVRINLGTIPGKAQGAYENETAREHAKADVSADDEDLIAKTIGTGVNPFPIADVIGRMSGPQRLRVEAKILRINPDWTPAQARTSMKLMDSFTSGQDAKQIASFGTFLGHAGEAVDVAQQLRVTGSPIINKPINELRKDYAGDPTVSRYLAAQLPVLQEYASFLKNNFALHEEDEKAVKEILSDSSTIAQKDAALKQMGRSAFVRLNQIDEKWKRVYQRSFPDMLNEDAVKGAQKLGLGTEAQRYDTGGVLFKRPGAANTSITPQPAPDGTIINTAKGRMVKQNGQWVPQQ